MLIVPSRTQVEAEVLACAYACVRFIYFFLPPFANTQALGIILRRDIPEPRELWDNAEGKNKWHTPPYKPLSLRLGTTFQMFSAGAVETTPRMCSPQIAL